ncbi:MAG: M28 family peptidase [Candidatus Zixiibacteriota bacterium]
MSLIELDLSRPDDFDGAVALGLHPVQRRGNRFLIAADAADLAGIHRAQLPYRFAGDSLTPAFPFASSDEDTALDAREIPLTYCQPLSWASLAGVSDDPAIDTILRRISLDSLVTYATRLEALQTRFTFTDSNAVARDYLAAKFRSFGYGDVHHPEFFTSDRDYYPRGGNAYNVVCTKPGTVESDEVVVIGAHYDSRVVDGTDNFILAPGGDRNASGVAALLELAWALHGIPTRKRIMFVAFGAGEQGFVGAREVAFGLYDNTNLSVELMINLDGLAFTSDAHPDLTINSFETSYAYARLAAQMTLEHTWLKPRVRENTRSSDWEPFNAMGYHWVDIIEGDYNPAQNTAQDSVRFLNPPYWTEMTKLAALTAYVVAATPSAVDSLRLRDVGDGTSLEARWAPLPGADIVGYRVYAGTESGGLKFAGEISGAGTVRTIIGGLTEGQMYYVSVTGVTDEGRESSVLPEDSLTPQRLPRVPVGFRARAAFRSINVSWADPIELDIDHYVIYRGTDSLFLSILESNWPPTPYTDGRIEDRVRYYYRAEAVDREGNRSPMTPLTSARGATFDEGILVVNMTTGTPGDPVVEEQEAFYDSILASYVHTYLRPASLSQGVDRSEIGQFRTLIWVDDDAVHRQLPPDYWDNLIWYLSYGNSLIVAGWRTVEDLTTCRSGCELKAGDFLYDYLNVTGVYQMTPIDCLGGIGVEGFPSVVFDTARVPAAWEGRMGFLWGFKGGPDATIMLAYNSASGDSARQFNPVGMRRDTGKNKVAVVSLPLYFLREPDAAALTDTLLRWFGVGSFLPGDLNHDRAINVSDINRMVQAVYGRFVPIGGYAQIDFNGDCHLDILDILMLIHHVFYYPTRPLLTGCAD